VTCQWFKIPPNVCVRPLNSTVARKSCDLFLGQTPPRYIPRVNVHPLFFSPLPNMGASCSTFILPDYGFNPTSPGDPLIHGHQLDRRTGSVHCQIVFPFCPTSFYLDIPSCFPVQFRGLLHSPHVLSFLYLVLLFQVWPGASIARHPLSSLVYTVSRRLLSL